MNKNDMVIENGILKSVPTGLVEVVIPEGVTKIQGNVFFEMPSISKVVFPESLRTIGSRAFSSCTGLTEIIFQKGLERIEEGAFIGCKSLKKVIIPEGTISIGDGVFAVCAQLEEISLPNTLEEIGSDAFVGCKLLEELTVPDNIKVINRLTFSGCKSLKRVKLPYGIEEIKDYAFADCESLKKIEIPESARIIGEGAFTNCSSLEEITIPENVGVILKATFSGCRRLKNLSLPKKLLQISEFAFQSCTSLQQINIPNTVRDILHNAFENCWSLKTINLPVELDGLWGRDIFRNCRSLKEIVIPKKIKRIESGTFYYCTNLEKVTLPLELQYIDYYETFWACNSLKEVVVEEDREATKEMGYFKHISMETRIKREIKKATKGLNVNISFVAVNKEEKEKREQSAKNDNNQDSDIQKLLNEIDFICKTLPEESRNIINSRVNDILRKYNEEKERTKPRFSQKENILELGDNSIRMSKVQVLASLEGIIYGLSTKKELINLLSRLYKYKSILTEGGKEVNKDDLIEIDIRKILYFSKYLDGKRKKDVLNRLGREIDVAINGSSSKLKEVDTDNILEINHIDYEKELKLNISKLCDEVEYICGKIKPYKVLLDSLNNVDTEENSITSDIKEVYNIISRITNDKYLKIVQDKFNTIRQKYIEKIKIILSDDTLLNQVNFDDIERSLREDLTPLLELIIFYANSDKYKEETANEENLKKELLASISLLNKDEINEDFSLSVIVSFVNDIYKSIINNNEFDELDKEEMIKALYDALNNSLAELENIKIETLEEYNKILRKILNNIAKVKLDIDKFLNKKREYNKYTK